jgi:hypothetical protein
MHRPQIPFLFSSTALYNFNTSAGILSSNLTPAVLIFTHVKEVADGHPVYRCYGCALWGKLDFSETS